MGEKGTMDAMSRSYFVRDAAAQVAGALREMDLMLFPRGCAGCGAPDDVLCPSCMPLFDCPVRREFPPALISSGYCYSCCSYAGAVRRAILQWKDHDDVQVGRLFARFLSHRACEVVPPICTPGSRIAVVPLPSTRASIARRGRFHTVEISRPVSRALEHSLAGQEIAVRHVCAVNFHVGARKSVKGTVAQRQHRSRTQMYVRSRAYPILRAYPSVILVDDICTTGSTLLGCSRVLRAAGFHVLCAMTLAAVLPSQLQDDVH